jgi:prevent-host-death family protein
MSTVNIHEAKTQFSKLIARVEAGEEIVIARDGSPVARLVAVRKPTAKRVSGRDRGLFSVSEDFDAPLPESILAEFDS